MQVIEHVADPEDFCRSLAALTKKDGLVFISTLNRSLPSFGLAIVAAEYILGWVLSLPLSCSEFKPTTVRSLVFDIARLPIGD